jgi:hypothetical protein
MAAVARLDLIRLPFGLHLMEGSRQVANVP